MRIQFNPSHQQKALRCCYGVQRAVKSLIGPLYMITTDKRFIQSPSKAFILCLFFERASLAMDDKYIKQMHAIEKIVEILTFRQGRGHFKIENSKIIKKKSPTFIFFGKLREVGGGLSQTGSQTLNNGLFSQSKTLKQCLRCKGSFCDCKFCWVFFANYPISADINRMNETKSKLSALQKNMYHKQKALHVFYRFEPTFEPNYSSSLTADGETYVLY